MKNTLENCIINIDKIGLSDLVIQRNILDRVTGEDSFSGNSDIARGLIPLMDKMLNSVFSNHKGCINNFTHNYNFKELKKQKIALLFILNNSINDKLEGLLYMIDEIQDRAIAQYKFKEDDIFDLEPREDEEYIK